MSKNEILKLFPEPVFKFKIEKSKTLNEDLTNYIYRLRDEDRDGIERSNRGGWHSKNFQINETKSVQHKFAMEVQKYILETFVNLGWKTQNTNIQIKEMWAIINKKDDFNVIHTHPNCLLSAAYYVKASKNCVRFQIECPNIAKRHYFPSIAKQNELNVHVAGIEIEEGDLLLFPAYMPHKVGKNQSDEDRIVISFNVDIK